jgi:hypothetical protein
VIRVRVIVVVVVVGGYVSTHELLASETFGQLFAGRVQGCIGTTRLATAAEAELADARATVVDFVPPFQYQCRRLLPLLVTDASATCLQKRVATWWVFEGPGFFLGGRKEGGNHSPQGR